VSVVAGAARARYSVCGGGKRGKVRTGVRHRVFVAVAVAAADVSGGPRRAAV
jgi:hypothetical protein